jgi:PKD repeat protein
MFKTAPRSILAVLLPMAALVLTVTLLNPPATGPVWAASTPSAGNVITVTAGIQAALDAASPGDTVVIPAGTYTENVTLNKPVSLTAWGPVTIQAGGGQRALTATGPITSSVVISGLTFTGGNLGGTTCPASCGGGLLLSAGAGPLIVNSIVRNNTAYQGGGIYADAASDLQLRNVQILTNAAADNGGGVFAQRALTLSQVTLINNTAAGGGGVYHTGSGAGYLVNVLAARNTATTGGAGLAFNSSGKVIVLHTTLAAPNLNSQPAIEVSAGSVHITNTILASHTVGLRQTGGSVSQDYNLFFGNTTNRWGTISNGTHGQTGDPVFKQPAAGDFHLGIGSAAIDAGAAVSVSIDLDGRARPLGAGSDIGAAEADVPIAGLSAATNSPIVFGHPTVLTASVTAGTNIGFKWKLGNGQAANGRVITHVYTAVGVYTATVTAVNSANGPFTATAPAIILDIPIGGLTAGNNSPSLVNSTTYFTASTMSGTNTVYQWNFGDGQLGHGQTLSHTYRSAGTYTAIVTATNGNSAPIAAATAVTVTTDLQTIIEARRAGEVIQIPAGVYTGSLLLTKPVGLVAVGSVTILAGSDQPALTISGSLTSGVVISGLTFTGGNLSGDSCPASCGGGLHLRGGASPLIVDSIVRNNIAYRGGGVYADAASDLQLRNVQILTNVAGNNGGGVFANRALTLSQVTLINNTAANGGGIYHIGNGPGYLVNVLAARNTATTDGAGFTLNSSGAVKIIHATVAGVGLNPQTAIEVRNGAVSVTNSIITSHTTGLYQTGASSASEDYNLFFGNLTDQAGIVNAGGHTVSADPLYLQPVADNFHVAWGSPAMEAGTDAGINLDRDGHTRPISASFDLGAYETDLPIDHLQLHNNGPQFVQRPVTFTAQTDGGTNIAYTWNFGDGTSPEAGRVPVVGHSYRRVGIFTVTVTADNNLSSPIVATTTVFISGLMTWLPLIVYQYQIYPIQGLTLRGEDLIPLARVITFSAVTTAGNEAVYDWNFGDGPTWQRANAVVSHAYGLTGSYTVVVSATNSVSGPYTASLKVKVNPSIQAWIDAPNSHQVTVPPGLYKESLVLNKPVSLVAATGLTPTVIMAETGRRVLEVVGSNINNSTIISGFTFSHGVLTSTLYPAGCGGGIRISGGANPVIRNSIITGNLAYRGGGVCTEAGSSLTLLNTTLTRNTAADAGGGLYVAGGLNIQASALIANFAARGGGLYHTGTGDGTIVNTLFARNTAAQLGAAAMLSSTGRVSWLHDTIADITLNPDAALEIMSGAVGVTNTIVTSHAIGLSRRGGVAFESYNLFFNTPRVLTGTLTSFESRTGDPAFVNVAADNYQLAPGSLALDWAVPAGITVDFEGDPRPSGSGYEVGMDEADAPIAGLTLSSTSPVMIGAPITFTAAIIAGTHVQYQWNFGDGIVTQTQGSATVQHRYTCWGTFTAVVTASNSLNSLVAASLQVTVNLYNNNFFLPLILHRWPPVPGAPVLQAISNPTGLGSYTVSWTPADALTASYLLQEAQQGDFTDAVLVYAGTATSHTVSGQGPTRYYYRVLGRNSWGDGRWSNVQAVDVLWEQEPNDDVLIQANGAIVSGLTYYGVISSAADRQDYFYFDLPAAHTIELWLTDIPDGSNYDLYLRAPADLDHPVGTSNKSGNADEHILTGVLSPGRYYIQIYNRSATGSEQDYHLRTVYR